MFGAVENGSDQGCPHELSANNSRYQRGLNEEVDAADKFKAAFEANCRSRPCIFVFEERVTYLFVVGSRVDIRSGLRDSCAACCSCTRITYDQLSVLVVWVVVVVR